MVVASKLIHNISFVSFFGRNTPHPQQPVLSCGGPKGVRSRLGVKALPVFANILTYVVQEIRWVDRLNPSSIVPIFHCL